MDAFNMTAPASQGKERKQVELVPAEQHVGILYSMIDLGDQWNQTYNKWQRKLQLIWELPLEKRVFYDGEPEKPCAIFGNFTFTISDKSHLKVAIEQMIGRPLQKSEYNGANGFNVGSLLGKKFMVNVVHKPDRNDPNKVYENAASLSPITERTMALMAGIQWEQIVQTNPTRGFAINDSNLAASFTSPAFGEIFGKTREKIIGSRQGQEHAQNGGTFYEKPEEQRQPQQAPPQGTYPQGNNPSVQQPAPQGTQPPSFGQPTQQTAPPSFGQPTTTGQPQTPQQPSGGTGFSNMPDPSKFVQ